MPPYAPPAELRTILAGQMRRHPRVVRRWLMRYIVYSVVVLALALVGVAVLPPATGSAESCQGKLCLSCDLDSTLKITEAEALKYALENPDMPAADDISSVAMYVGHFLERLVHNRGGYGKYACTLNGHQFSGEVYNLSAPEPPPAPTQTPAAPAKPSPPQPAPPPQSGLTCADYAAQLRNQYERMKIDALRSGQQDLSAWRLDEVLTLLLIYEGAREPCEPPPQGQYSKYPTEPIPLDEVPETSNGVVLVSVDCTASGDLRVTDEELKRVVVDVAQGAWEGTSPELLRMAINATVLGLRDLRGGTGGYACKWVAVPQREISDEERFGAYGTEYSATGGPI